MLPMYKDASDPNDPIITRVQPRIGYNIMTTEYIILKNNEPKLKHYHM